MQRFTHQSAAVIAEMKGAVLELAHFAALKAITRKVLHH